MYLDKVVTARRFTEMMDSFPGSGKGVITSLVQPSRHLGRPTGRDPIGLWKGCFHVTLPVAAEYQKGAERQKQSMIVHYNR